MTRIDGGVRGADGRNGTFAQSRDDDAGRGFVTIDEPWARACVAPFESSLDVVAVVTCDGEVAAINRTLAGVSPEDAAGRALCDLVHPAHREALAAALSAVRNGASPRRLEVECEVPDAAPAWYQLSVAPLAREGDIAALIVTAADITEHHETAARLRRAEALMVDTQGTAHLGTWEWDISQPTAVWSDELYRIYGLSPEDYVPSYERYLAMVHPDDRAHVMAATERVFRELLPYSHDERIYRPDGSLRYLHTWAHALVDESGKLTRLIGVCQDITDRKLAEVALEERASELSRANERLRHEMAERARVEAELRQSQKLEALGRLAGGIAHDFNNMMSVVLGYGGIVMKSLAPGDPQRAFVEEMVRAGERASGLTRQLLAFGREQVVEREVLDVNRVVSDLARMLRQLIREDVELVLRLGDAVPCHVDANRSQLQQVITNLVVNARDAMPRGGTVTVSTRVVDVTEDARVVHEVPPGEYVCLTVADTGEGMTEEVRARIFDPFFTTKAPGRGTGLGLSTVYGAVKQSGGAIAVTSAPGQGARFDVYLPCARGGAPLASTLARGSSKLTGTETVLVVEDEEALRGVLHASLESYGYAVLSAADAAEALCIVQEHPGTIHVMLTDVVLPRMNGRELCQRVLAARPGVRVVYMSGYAADEALRRDVAEGLTAFLAKPFTPEELAERLRATLDAPPR